MKKRFGVGLAAEIALGTGRPTNIDVLYAIGIGGGDPGPLLASHVDGGRFGLMAPGMATTSVDGRPMAAIGGDSDEWRGLVATQGKTQAGTTAVFSSMVGSAPVADELGAVPGGDSNHVPLNRALVATLWPALWGHSLGDINGVSDADQLGLWAADNVVPEGPLPVLRVGKQPYGILPVTSLSRWQRDSGRSDSGARSGTRRSSAGRAVGPCSGRNIVESASTQFWRPAGHCECD